MGVFATRSPYRPNPIGLSSVRLLDVQYTEDEGTVLTVGGADLLSGTPIYDVKPYLAYTDSHPEAKGGFADDVLDYKIKVEFTGEAEEKLSECEMEKLKKILEQDPRPSYKAEDERSYGMRFEGKEVTFKYENGKLLVTNIE